VKPLFEDNGFSPFESTYVRCYTNAQWRIATHGDSSIMGWYRAGSWINVRSATCSNAVKLLGKGQLSYTNVVALATLMHETIHRQGVHDEGTAECLGDWMTGHAVWAWTGSLKKGQQALGFARLFAQRRLLARYRTTNTACARLAVARGIQPLTENPDSSVPAAPAPSPTPTPTQPPVAPAAPPVAPPPAIAAVVFDQTYTMTDSGVLPLIGFTGAHRVEVTYSVTSGGDGFWSGPDGTSMDYGLGRPVQNGYLGFGALRSGESTTVKVDNLSGENCILNLAVYQHTGSKIVWADPAGTGVSVPFNGIDYPGPITIRVVAYS
jgi:hypothetical protein